MKLIYKKGSKILTNKYFLYFVFIITFIYLFQLILAKKINIIILFGLISYIVFCFNKNMAIVLGVSLIITYITTLGMRVKEGFDTATASADKTAAQTTISADKAIIAANNPEAASDKATIQNDAAASDSTSGTSTLSNIVNNAKSKIQSTLGTTEATTTDTTTTTEPSSTTESMNVMSNKKRNRIDYASTVQDAYEDLNSMLGQDGIKGLTLDTNKLIEQQAQLASAMKNMTPLVKTAKELLNGFNFEGMNDISNMAKQFMPSK
jgi:hypothetical protein